MRPLTAIAATILAAVCTTAAAEQCWNCLGVRQIGVGHVRFPCPVCEGTGTTGSLEAPGASAPGSAEAVHATPAAAAGPDSVQASPVAASTAGAPRPVVARVRAGSGRISDCGSGVLVAARGEQGIVLTNWHVVRGNRSEVTVRWPDGTQSAARVLASDDAWDLAALLCDRPAATPVTIAAAGPKIGDRLTIAGFGPNDVYREQSGLVTQYLSPTRDHPKQFVEMRATARQGDSGGPMFDVRGDLAGVLFGERDGLTCGSCSTRLRTFLSGVRWPADTADPAAKACPDGRCAIR